MKIYNNFSDKFGNKYSFDNYLDFAQFWFNLSYKSQCEGFGELRTKLQNAAATSREARTKYKGN